MVDPPSAPGRWLVLYDADCGLCMVLLSPLLRWDKAAVLAPIALQRGEAQQLLDALTPAERMASWHLISPRGQRLSGAAALPALLALLPRGRPLAAGFARFPGLSDRGYRWVAEHRSQLSPLIPAALKRRGREAVRGRERATDAVRP